MMQVITSFTRLVGATPSLRVSGTVSDAAGNPLSRMVVLYNAARVVLATAWSDAQGVVSFDLPPGYDANDWFTARGVGSVNECDDVSCPVRGAP